MLAIALGVIVLWSINACSKKSSSDTSSNGLYFPKVKSIIQNNCLSCHSSSGNWSGRPTSFDSDSSISAQYAIIYQAIAGPFTFYLHKMPQGGSLSVSDSTTIATWYNRGGKITD